MKDKKKRWTRTRHRVIFNLLRPILGGYTRWRYGVKVERCEALGDRQCLILFNHQTGFDQFFPAMAFPQPIYFVATEDIFSIGWVSRLIEWLVAPIPIKKQTTDVGAVMNCIRVAREGGTIAIAPEGNRTFSGKMCHMNPAIGALAKKLKLPIAIFRIEDGYGVQPRWSDVIRKGRMRAWVSRVIEPEEYATLTNEAMSQLIERELAVNEGRVTGQFHSPKLAEYLERAVYVCPQCGLSEFESHGDLISCKKCGRQIRYLPTKELEGVGFDFPFRFVCDWYDYQCNFMNALDISAWLDTPLYRDRAKLSEVIVYKRKKLLRRDVSLTLYGDRIVMDEGRENALLLPFDEVSVISVLGKNKLNIYHGKMIYQLKSGKRFNALKYMNTCYRYKNWKKEDENGEFLGL